jgi:hypothetical protein
MENFDQTERKILDGVLDTFNNKISEIHNSGNPTVYQKIFGINKLE